MKNYVIDSVSDRILNPEESVEILEVAQSALTFLGLEDKLKKPTVRKWDKENCARVIVDEQFGTESNMPTYSLTVQIQFSDGDNVNSIHVSESRTMYDGYKDLFTDLFEGDYDETSKDTYFRKLQNGQLEVKSVITEEKGTIDSGVPDIDSRDPIIDVYEFNGDWKNLSPDMKKVNRARQKGRTHI